MKSKGLTEVFFIFLCVFVISQEVCTKPSFLETYFIQNSVALKEGHAPPLWAIILLETFQMCILVTWMGRRKDKEVGKPEKLTDKEAVINSLSYPLYFGESL